MKTREDELNQALEAMHFGFRSMVYKPDQRLSKLGYSRIHHRLLYFVGRHEGCSINELLQILGVTKQYLNRPLRTLVMDGCIDQQMDCRDRRVKRLKLTSSGRLLEQELSGQQRKKFASIFDQVGPNAEKHWRQVMRLLGKDIGL